MEPSIIENFVGPYIGCQVDTGKTGLATNLGLFYNCKNEDGEPTIPQLGGITLFFKEIGDQTDKLVVADFNECKLALRPFMDMNEEEATTIAHHVFFNHYEFDDIRAEKKSGDKWIVYYRDITSDYKVCIVLTDGKVGIYNGVTRKYDDAPFDLMCGLTPWLLDKQFDIFKLIQQGVAVDITKLKR